MSTGATTDTIRRRLEAERADLQEQIGALPVGSEDQPTDEGAGNHLADDASDLFIRERNLALRASTEDAIARVDAALARLEDGSYGTCARCGQPIGDDRLEALPAAIYCVGCQSELEREG